MVIMWLRFSPRDDRPAEHAEVAGLLIGCIAVVNQRCLLDLVTVIDHIALSGDVVRAAGRLRGSLPDHDRTPSDDTK